MVLGLREISYLHSGVIYDNGGGATPSPSSLETPLDYFNKHKSRLEKLVKLYSETLENIIRHDDTYRSILSHIKKGFNDIVNELFTKIQFDPHTHWR